MCKKYFKFATHPFTVWRNIESLQKIEVALYTDIDIENKWTPSLKSRALIDVCEHTSATLARDRIVYFWFNCTNALHELVFGGIDFGAANNGRGGGFGGK